MRLFISYSHQDDIWCDGFVTSLKVTGLDVWFDERSLKGGNQWQSIIEEQIRTCNVFLLAASPNAINSRWVREEFYLAHRLNKIIYPVMYVQTELPGFMGANQYLNVVGLKPFEAAQKVVIDLQQLNAEDPIHRKTEAEDNTVVPKYQKPDFPLRLLKLYSHIPSPFEGDRVNKDFIRDRLQAIAELFLYAPELGTAYDETISSFTSEVSESASDLFIRLFVQYNKNPPIIQITLVDKQNRVEEAKFMSLNLTRFARRHVELVQLFHNGDTSPVKPYREGSYGNGAPYSLTVFATKLFLELRTDSPDYVYLGTLPAEGPITREHFANVYHRLVLYTFARWMWFRDHPLRKRTSS